jgi:hypothetical protein
MKSLNLGRFGATIGGAALAALLALPSGVAAQAGAAWTESGGVYALVGADGAKLAEFSCNAAARQINIAIAGQPAAGTSTYILVSGPSNSGFAAPFLTTNGGVVTGVMGAIGPYMSRFDSNGPLQIKLGSLDPAPIVTPPNPALIAMMTACVPG